MWAFSAKAGHAKEENRQRLEGRLPPTAGSLIFRPTRRVGHDFLELQCGKTNAGQLLLRALEEKAPFSPFSMNALLRWPREILSKRLTMPLTSQSDMMPWGVWLPPTTGKEDDAPGTVLLPTAGKEDDAPGTVLLPTATAGKNSMMPPPLNHHRRQRVPTQVLALVVVLPAPLVIHGRQRLAMPLLSVLPCGTV